MNNLVDNLTYYRAVNLGSDVTKYRRNELGIYCGSFAQAKYLSENKFYSMYDIYEIILRNECTFSNIIDDPIDEWTSFETITKILLNGFELDKLSEDIKYELKEYNSPSKYLVDTLKNHGIKHPVIRYNNEQDIEEVDICILDKNSIQSAQIIDSTENCK